ncbi:flagellar hook-associated protein FlgL [Arthrobacter sp. AL08]|uniref:flagellar hook-associated protein FlgL n=1 Tax=Micrococcaceae TaxID=1268 RepID=UPI001CFF79F6|nr:MULTISPECIES: flagellar hook-associated protein FlgL [Micrococcaceae]MCB5283762.1 Flagellar hook-associated protein 3 [Arthrobacter sp. ES1]MDI3242928.1 flagellar hook-associated protein FlgL [Arthrobacter sp. AL05]MDI3279002.1 flagellar hook-associated protein FlgL [Arthrobacter sp. AL08]MDJ0353365.1 flagellar hook-associated protein FlgL [Pseudarthrobacter sp. PH31-O2]WGZ79933.1 flagellar hook-associated protein FlgL [Arthrobacter sp. EM1]
MLNRVTNLTMSANAQRTLQTQQSRLAELQEKATTLNKISRPSDDPAATAKALETRSLLAANAQYGRNIDDGNTWLTAADSALEQATNVMHKIKDLTVLAGNGSLPQSGKIAIANELDALNSELVSIANTKHLGRNIFAGNSDNPEAFSGPVPPTFNGTGLSPVERRFSATQTVRVDADGEAVFGTGSTSVFGAVKSIADALKGGTAPTSLQIGNLDAGFTHIVDGRAEIGTRQAQLERAGNVNTDLEANLDAQKMGIEKLDLGSVIMDLKLQETNYQVALAATARVLQPTLMDFLR